MSSTNKTANYELSQYIGSDKPTYLGDYNSDMLKIDTQMKANADEIIVAKTSAQTANTTAGTALSTAQTANQNAQSAGTTASTANSTANTALAKALENEVKINKMFPSIPDMRVTASSNTIGSGGSYASIVLNNSLSNTATDYLEMNSSNNQIIAKKKCQVLVSGDITFKTTMPNGSQVWLLKNGTNPWADGTVKYLRRLIDFTSQNESTSIPAILVDLDVNDTINIMVYSPNNFEIQGESTYFNFLVLRDLTSSV